jgi:hypothetical protein
VCVFSQEEVIVTDPDTGKTIECYVDQDVTIDGKPYYIVRPPQKKLHIASTFIADKKKCARKEGRTKKKGEGGGGQEKRVKQGGGECETRGFGVKYLL